MELTPSQIKKIDLWVKRVVFILSIVMTAYVVEFTLKHSPPGASQRDHSKFDIERSKQS